MTVTSRHSGRYPVLRYSTGITILEALIASIILAGGLMGMAALYIESLQSASDSYYRSRATDLAADLADRMRANLLAVTDDNKPYEASTDCATVNSEDLRQCITGSCTPAEMATFDLAQLRCENGVDDLPAGALTVSCQDDSPFVTTADPCDDASNHIIEVTWRASVSSSITDVNGKSEVMRMSVMPGVPR